MQLRLPEGRREIISTQQFSPARPAEGNDVPQKLSGGKFEYFAGFYFSK
jgi:hypothetical protein